MISCPRVLPGRPASTSTAGSRVEPTRAPRSPPRSRASSEFRPSCSMTRTPRSASSGGELWSVHPESLRGRPFIDAATAAARLVGLPSPVCAARSHGAMTSTARAMFRSPRTTVATWPSSRTGGSAIGSDPLPPRGTWKTVAGCSRRKEPGHGLASPTGTYRRGGGLRPRSQHCSPQHGRG